MLEAFDAGCCVFFSLSSFLLLQTARRLSAKLSKSLMWYTSRRADAPSTCAIIQKPTHFNTPTAPVRTVFSPNGKWTHNFRIYDSAVCYVSYVQANTWMVALEKQRAIELPTTTHRIHSSISPRAHVACVCAHILIEWETSMYSICSNVSAAVRQHRWRCCRWRATMLYASPYIDDSQIKLRMNRMPAFNGHVSFNNIIHTLHG